MAATGGALQSLAVSHPGATYTTLSTALAFFALTPAPSLIPVIALLATVRLSTVAFCPRPGGFAKAALQAVAIALSSGAAHLAPSLEALSSPNTAVVIVSIITFFTSAFAVAVVFVGYQIGRARGTHWSRLTVFPALWASGWGSMSSVSPLGQLITWSPVHGLGPYEWLRPFLGQWGIDWVAAAWAVVLSEVLGDWLVGSPDPDANAEVATEALVDSAPLLHDDSDVPAYGAVAPAPKPAAPRPSRSLARSRSVPLLAALLVLLMLPTYTMPTMPLPVIPSIDTTPVTVACALPLPHQSGGNPTLNDYITATEQLQSLTTKGRDTVILWPESAVRFESPAEKDEAFARIQNLTAGRKYVGVSFEEYVPSQDRGKKGARYNSFALLSHSEVLFEYRKRNLVPVAESMSLTPGHEVPPIVTLNLTKPTDWKGPGWSRTGSTRPVALTASICLDFASAASFTALPERPALVLAPARTWHPSVGAAMWAQARARAAESGATVLWCDGGAGGLSGLASARHSAVVQVGPGPWARPLGLPYLPDARRTWFMAGGQGAAAAAVWAVALAGFLVEGGVGLVDAGRAVGVVRRVVESLRKKRSPMDGNLIDV